MTIHLNNAWKYNRKRSFTLQIFVIQQYDMLVMDTEHTQAKHIQKQVKKRIPSLHVNGT